MIELTRKQIAELRGCSPATVSRAKLSKTDSGKYDLLNREVWQYVTAPTAERAVYEHQRKVAEEHSDDSEGLEAQKTQEEILRIREQRKKLELQNAELMRDIIPFDVFDQALGHFAAALRTNILTIGEKIARGDKVLRDRIEGEVKKRIERTIESAQADVDRIIDRKVDERKESEAWAENEN